MQDWAFRKRKMLVDAQLRDPLAVEIEKTTLVVSAVLLKLAETVHYIAIIKQ